MSSSRHWAGIVAAATVLVATGCSEDDTDPGTSAQRTIPASTPTPTSVPPTPATTPTGTPTPTATPIPEPRRSFVTIDDLDLRDFPVRRYRGSPDDAGGIAIQNDGDMASPRGERGGVGPGEVGNLIITGHRLSSSMPLRYSPSLERGDRIRVRSGDTVFVYEVRRTRWTSFRSPASPARNGRPCPAARASRPPVR